MDGALRGGFPRTACNQGIVHHRAHGDHGEFSIFPSVCSAFSVAMRTFFAGVAFLLFTLAVCPAPTHADPISDQQLVSLDDGGLACVFKLGDYDKTRDGDIFVVVSGAAGRTVYRPEQNIVEGTQWQGFWGVRLGADVKAGQIDVIVLKNPPAPDAPAEPPRKGRWTLVNLDLKVLGLKIDAEDNRPAGYTLYGDFKIVPTGTFSMTGNWDPSNPTAPMVFEADNIYKSRFEQVFSSIPKDWFQFKDKMNVTIGLDEQWIENLKNGTSFDAGKMQMAGSSAVAMGKGATDYGIVFNISFPMKLKIDPTQDAFDMVATIIPIKGVGTLALDEGQVWDKPFGIIPARFDQLEVGSNPAFTDIIVNASGHADFLGDMDFEVNIELQEGEKPQITINAQSSGDLVASVMKRYGVPATLTEIVGQIHLEEFKVNANLEDMSTRSVLPSATLKLRVDDISGATYVDVDVPEMDFTKKNKFVKVVGEQIIKLATDLMTQRAANILKIVTDPVGAVTDAADKAADAAQDLAVSTKDFFNDPGRNTQELANSAAKMAEDLGKQAVATIAADLEQLATDPIGTAVKAAQAAYDAAVSVANAIADFISSLGKAILKIITGPSEDDLRRQREADEAKSAADKKLQDLRNQAKDFEQYKKDIASANTMSDIGALIATESFKKKYPHLTDTDELRLRGELQRRTMAIVPTESESMSWWRNMMSSIFDVSWFDDAIKFMDGTQFPNNDRFSNVSKLSAGNKGVLKRELKSWYEVALLNLQKRTMDSYRRYMDRATTIQDVLIQVNLINVDIAGRLSEDQIAKLKKYADAAIARLNAAKFQEFTDRVNFAVDKESLDHLRKEVESSGDLTETQKADLKNKISAAIPDIKTQGLINA